MKHFIFFLFFVILSSSVYAAGLGVAPATLKFENALVNTTTTKYLTIQNPGDEEIQATIEIKGELANLIEAEQATSVPPKGSSQIAIKLTPTEIGKFTSKVHVRAQASADIEGSGMGLLPGVDTSIEATITDQQIISGKVTKILTKDEIYGNPIIFTIGFDNYGNIPLGPKIIIEIVKRGSGVIDIIEQSMEEIEPGMSKDYQIEWDTNNQEKDVYLRANVEVSLNREIIEEKEDIGFRIVDDAIAKDSLTKAIKGQEPLNPVGIAISLIIIIVGLIIYKSVTKKK